MSPDTPSDDYARAVEDVATWLERCCREGSLYDRANMAAKLRLGAWRDMPARRTADRDVPVARAQAERWLRQDMDRKARADAARAAVAAGAAPLHDYYGMPRGYGAKDCQRLIDALGGSDNPSAVRVYDHGADGVCTVRDGAGVVLEQYPIARRPRRNTRLAGHALGVRVNCLVCRGRTKTPPHPSCQCGAWRPADFCMPPTKTDERRWHDAHKRAVRAHAEAVVSGVVRDLPTASER